MSDVEYEDREGYEEHGEWDKEKEMAKFTSERINSLYEKNLAEAKEALRGIEVCCHTAPTFAGLGGWVFEQTIQYCLTKELAALGFGQVEFKEQESLGGRAKVDLVVGRTAVEIKLAGLFSEDDAERYGRYQQAARRKELDYVFVSAWGEYPPYRKAIIAALGSKNVFYLNEEGGWERLVARIAQSLAKDKNG